MSAIRARVQNGRLLLDAPTALPEGTVLDLVIDDEGDDFDERARRAQLGDFTGVGRGSVRQRPARQRSSRCSAQAMTGRPCALAT
jgi:hypothetical protein